MCLLCLYVYVCSPTHLPPTPFTFNHEHEHTHLDIYNNNNRIICSREADILMKQNERYTDEHFMNVLQRLTTAETPIVGALRPAALPSTQQPTRIQSPPTPTQSSQGVGTQLAPSLPRTFAREARHEAVSGFCDEWRRVDE